MGSEERVKVEPKGSPHPGDMVIEYLEHHGWSQRELARRTGLTPKNISEICSGKAPISPQTSLALERVFQRPAHFWLNLQAHYDEAEARKRAREKTVGWSEWAAKFPLAKMKRLGYLDNYDASSDDASTLLSFFAVSTPENWSSVWSTQQVAYRQTRQFELSIESVAAWVRAVELKASELRVSAYDDDRFLGALNEARLCTRLRVDKAIEPVQDLCRAAGVAVVWVPELPRTGISGCARRLPSGQAIIGLTLRYKTDDQLWFSFFHEGAHVLRHLKERALLLDNAFESLVDRVVDPGMQQIEDEANRFAADTLLPPEPLAEFIRTKKFGNEEIHDFAERMRVGPGIVVARLQHEGLLKWHQGNRLKQQLSWGIREDE